MTEPDLYVYLRRECPDLPAAKRWIRRWASEWGQRLPWERSAGFTCRAMAGHLSNVLEGGTPETGYAGGDLTYLDTKYGAQLCDAAWEDQSGPPPSET